MRKELKVQGKGIPVARTSPRLVKLAIKGDIKELIVGTRIEIEELLRWPP